MVVYSVEAGGVHGVLWTLTGCKGWELHVHVCAARACVHVACVYTFANLWLCVSCDLFALCC